MKSVYLPAIVPYVVDTRKWLRPIHWLDPAFSDVYYSHVLLSYFHWEKFPWEFRETETVFGDSGGYSLVTRRAKIDPEQVVRWQIRNCTRGVMLDIPPYRSSSIQFAGAAAQHWGESLKRTLMNVTRACPYYLKARDAGSKFRWWGVVQGETLDQMEIWHDAVHAVYPFTGEGEGWALAPKPSTDVLSITRYMRFATEREIKNVHLLQVTGPKAVALLLALGQLGGFHLVTFDSASAARNAINRGGIVPRDGGRDFTYVKQKGDTGEVTEMMRGCSCPSCTWWREDLGVDYDLRDAEFTHRILLHNHLIMAECFIRLHVAAVADPEALLRWAAGRLYGAVLREWGGSLSSAKSQHSTVSIFDHL